MRWTIKTFLVLTVLSLTFNTLTRPPQTLRAPSGSDIRTGGARRHYERWGTSGTPIVLVHGFAESTVSWRDTAKILGRDHVVIAVDLPGFGYSEYTGRYDLANQVKTLVGLLQALHLHDPVLVGHSLGAAIVGETARSHPQKVGGVIFADGDAMGLAGGSGRSAMSWALRTPHVTSLFRIVTRWTWLDQRIVKTQCGTRCSGHSDELVRAWMRPRTQGGAQTAMADMAGQRMPAMTPQQVQSIHVRRGIIWGAEDTSSGGSLAGAQRNLGNPRTVILPDAGHLSMTADPAGFASGVRKIMNGWSA